MAAFVYLFFTPAFNGLPKLQTAPTVLRVIYLDGWVTLIVLLSTLIITLLFGRIFCSVLCPLGITQDICSWTARKIFRSGKFRSRKNHWLLRYSLLLALTISAVMGLILPLTVLAPYSFFGRTMSNLVRPAALWLNNSIYHWSDSKYLEPVGMPPLLWWAVIFSATAIVILIVVSSLYGRLFCNTVCPVGAILGLLSRHAVFRLKLNENCTGCRACEKVCKAGCIDVEKRELDFERCVMCLDCASACRFKAIDLSHGKTKHASETDKSRRVFLAGLGAAGVSALVLPPLLKPLGKSSKLPIMPPGAGSIGKFTSVCTSCHLCVSSCPGKVIKPAFMEYGLGGMMVPRMDFSHGMCEYECSTCSNVCPTGALKPLTTAKKTLVRIGLVKYYKERCVVVTDETHCGACAEHCPTGAIQMVPWRDGLVIPKVFPEYCIGCGCCEYICPVRPEKAVIVHGLKEQQTARKLVSKKAKPAKASGDFPF